MFRRVNLWRLMNHLWCITYAVLHVNVCMCVSVSVCTYLYLYETHKSALSSLYCRSLYSKCRGSKWVFLTPYVFWLFEIQKIIWTRLCPSVLPLGKWYQLVSCLVCWLFNKCQQLDWSAAIVLLLVVFPYIPQERVSVYWCVYNEENIFRMNLTEVFPSWRRRKK